MKKRVVDFGTGSFVDFKGFTHKVIVVAVSKVVPNFNKDYPGLEVYTYEEGIGSDYYCSLKKTLSIGFSICHPEDQYNETIGYNKALARAESSTPVYYVTELGAINTTVAKAVIQDKIDFICKNPGLFIQGYHEAEKKYNEQKNIESEYASLDDDSKSVVNFLSRNLDKVTKLLHLSKFVSKQ